MKEQYPVVNRVVEAAKRFGRFIIETPKAHPHMSDYFKPQYVPEPQDGEPFQPHHPYDREQTAAYYVAMAQQARQEQAEQ